MFDYTRKKEKKGDVKRTRRSRANDRKKGTRGKRNAPIMCRYAVDNVEPLNFTGKNEDAVRLITGLLLIALTLKIIRFHGTLGRGSLSFAEIHSNDSILND